MRWSSTWISSNLPPSLILRVRSMSAWHGCRFPDGWFGSSLRKKFELPNYSPDFWFSMNNLVSWKIKKPTEHSVCELLKVLIYWSVIPLELKFFAGDCFRFPQPFVKPWILLPLLPENASLLCLHFAMFFDVFFFFATKLPPLLPLNFQSNIDFSF